ncbi:Acid-sensing ion channel 1 [Stylophora pistillata]|uniref:Acid-sensing ion channel 1 n=1 Tax=Stylophora pistillata TaxID=50429 RepID=A0A2B4S6E5_STYPI|nr:Acid-sensing ion channel 1 [Stylophora pistillata]
MQEKKLSQKSAQVGDNNAQSSTDIWREFVNGTTLHGIRYVFMRRQIFIRLIWMIMLLSSGGYYISTVYGAFAKYYDRPVTTLVSRNRLKEMDFPAVTICPLNLFTKSKIFMKDDDPLFASSGLNISTCAVTAEVRGNRPCGLSILCCCFPADLETDLPFCESQYKQVLLKVMLQQSNRLDVENFFRLYSQNTTSMIGPLCTFGWDDAACSPADFVPVVTPWGMCFTFNSGTDNEVKISKTAGVSSGLSVILDAQTLEYTQGKFSEGFKVLIHGQGEYIDEWEGINVGPGQHVVISLSQKRYQNLEKPYATNCTKKELNTYFTYTTEGCLYECLADNVINYCGCRPAGYKVTSGTPGCISSEELLCVEQIAGTADSFIKSGYYADKQYQSMERKSELQDLQ